jgi:hypothetical protein
MKLETIKNTAICRYSNEDGGIYIVESPLLEIICGAASTKAQAWEIFYDLAEAVYIEHLKGHTVAQYSRGRPSKGALHIHVQIQPKTRSGISALSKSLNISQGEVIDYLFAFFNAKSSEPIPPDNSREQLKSLEKQLKETFSLISELKTPAKSKASVKKKLVRKAS